MSRLLGPRWWTFFVPGVTLFAVAFVPLFAMDLWGRLFGYSDQLAGAGLAWGMVVAMPAGIAGGLALIGGFVALFVIRRKNSK